MRWAFCIILVSLCCVVGAQAQSPAPSPTIDETVVQSGGPSGWRERFNHLRRTGEVSPGNLPQVPVNLKEDYYRLLDGNLWLKQGGFVELDAFLDQGESVGPFAFTPSQIGTTPATDDRILSLGPDARLSFRRSRINLDAYLSRPALWQGTRLYAEVDFYGKDGAPRLRHAYVALPYLVAGRTDSAFRDTDAEPETVDVSGPNAMFGNRQQGIRAIIPLGEYRLALAAENPGGLITPSGFEARDDGLRSSIDLAGHLRANHDWGHLQLSGLYRNIKLEGFPEQPTSFRGWGIGLSGRRAWGADDNLLFEVALGDGIGRYITDLSGTDSEVGLDAEGLLGTQFAHSAYLGYQHHWSATLRSTLYGGYAQVELREGQPAASYRRGVKLALNLIKDLTDHDRVGVELIHGTREDRDGQSRAANRLQFFFRHSF